MFALWILLLVGALLTILAASRKAVDEVTRLALLLRAPPFLVGLTLVAIGTDLPEIANSIIASLAQHGDLNVGDSVGSAATQITLVLGLLPILGGAFRFDRAQAIATGSLTAAALLFGVFLVSDGRLSHADGALLVTSWIVASAVIWKLSPANPATSTKTHRSRGRHALLAIVYLGVVAAGAAIAVAAFIQISQLLRVPEYVISFLAASIGTSLPELVVDYHAIRNRASEIAIGNIFGSSLADASLSIGIGPLVAATAVSAHLAVRGGLAAAIVVASVTLLFSRIRQHDWRSGLLLLLLYSMFYPVLLLG